MLTHLKCYLSGSYNADSSNIYGILREKEIEVYEFYDGSIGTSFQDILKRKLRQVDFAIFILTKYNENTIYEIGVCEGLGIQSLIIIDKEFEKVPFFLENKLSLSANLNDEKLLKIAIDAFVSELPKKKKNPERIYINRMLTDTYDENIKNIFRSLLIQTRNLRTTGSGIEMEYVVEEIFRTLRMKYVHNLKNEDIGVDFAIWNDVLGRVIGNPIVVECKIGNSNVILSAVQQLKFLTEKSDSSLGLLLYLDRVNNRINFDSQINPFIIAFDLEDFIEALIYDKFENIILNKRNYGSHKNLH